MKKCCLDCKRPIAGRADKKFCDDACRSNYHNRNRSSETAYLHQINNRLKRNRAILKTLNPAGKIKVGINALRESGFDFSYFTEVYVTRAGREYRFCYEQGYLLLEHGRVLLVKRDIAPM